MKFENFEVEKMYCELHKKYGVIHTNHECEFTNENFTYDDLNNLEETFKNVTKIINKHKLNKEAKFNER